MDKKNNLYSYFFIYTYTNFIFLYIFLGWVQLGPYGRGWTQPARPGHWPKPVTRVVTVADRMRELFTHALHSAKVIKITFAQCQNKWNARRGETRNDLLGAARRSRRRWRTVLDERCCLLCSVFFSFAFFISCFFLWLSLSSLSLFLLVSVLCFFIFFVRVCSPVFLFWPVRLLCSWFYILSTSVLRWRDKDDGGADPRLCVLPLLFSPSLFRCFFSCVIPPSLWPSLAFIKPENGLSSRVRASRSWGTNASVSLRRNRGKKFAPLCVCFFRMLLPVFLPRSRSLSLSLFFFPCFCFVCFSLSPAGSLPLSVFFLSFSVSPGFFLPLFSSLFLCFYRARPVVTDGMQRDDNH